MKTNARKLLSLILSFLMVFGSVAALLPTTVMAAEEDATTNFKVFTAYDLANAVNPDKSVNLTASINYDENGDAYLRVKPASTSANKNHIALDFGEAIGDYDYIQVEYGTNIPAGDRSAYIISYNSGEYSTMRREAAFQQYNFREYTSNKIFKTNAQSVEWSQWVKFCPWGAIQALAGYLDDDPGTEKPKLDEAYYDIKYIAFFYSQADANGFDYDTYFEETNKRTITVVVGDEEITIETSQGATVNLLDETGLPYTNEDGDFLTFVDSKGNAYPASTLAITDDLTLKAEYLEAKVYLADELLTTLRYKDRFNFSVVDNKLHMQSKSTGSHYVGWTFDIEAGYVEGAIKYTTNAYSSANRAAFVRQNGVKEIKLSYTSTILESVIDGSASETLEFTYNLDSALQYTSFDFAPWYGNTMKVLYGVDGDHYTSAYADVDYVAFFKDTGAAAAFDYDAYKNSLENDLYVTLENPAGEVISSTYVAKNGEFTFPGYTSTGDAVFVGWRSDAGETVVYKEGDKIAVTENVSFTAMLIDKFTVTLLDTDGTSELYSGKIVEGSVIDLSELAEISYRNADSDFLVWTNETNIYSDTYEVTGDITLKAKYAYADVYTSADMYTGIKGKYNNTNSIEAVGLSEDGRSYILNEITPSSGQIPFVFSTPKAIGTEDSVDNYFRVAFKTPVVINTSTKPFIYWDTDEGTSDGKSDLPVWGLMNISDNMYYIDGIVSVAGTANSNTSGNKTPETEGKQLNAIRIVPHGGQRGGTQNVETYMTYFASFETEAEAELFDYDKYVDSLSYTVKFLDKYGDPVGDEETYGFWEEIILPEAPELPGHTFKGWYSVADEKLIEDGSDFAFRDNTYIARYTRDTLVLTAKDIADNSLASVGSKSNLSYNGLVSSTDANGYSSQYVRFVAKADAIDGTTTSTTNDLALIDFEKYNIVYGNKLRDTENDYNCVRIGYKTNIDSYNDIINSRNYIGGGAYTALIQNTEGQVIGQDTKFYFSVSNTSSNEIKYHIEKFKELAYGTGYDEDGNFVTTTTADMKPYVEKFGFLPYGDSSQGASELSSDHYFDIEYIAFFATQEEAEAFDYADYSADFTIPVKLVAYIGPGDGEKGGFTVGDSSEEETHYTDFVSENKAIKLTAVAYDGYTPAYWVRFTQDSLTQVLLATGDTVEAYPLGGSVYYQPVFKANDETVSLYIDKATREIIADHTEYDAVINTTYSKDGLITVYDCTKKEEVEHNNPFIVYELGSETPVEIPEKFANPAFGDSVVINKSDENTAPKWTVELGEKVYTASYKNSFLFSYMFKAGTEVVVRENQLGDKAATPAISTVATWTEGNITRFTGLFALPNDYELINHGVMMSQDYEHLEALEDNETGELNVTATTIVGRVSDNSEDAAPLFTIAKRLSLGSEVWYGRAFLVYTDDGGTTHVVYADDILSSGIEEGEVEADYNYNPEVYNPMYWDDTIPVPAV